LEKRRCDFSALRVGLVRSEGGRIWRDFNSLSELAELKGAYQTQRRLFGVAKENLLQACETVLA
jgi:hypothetical protein